MRQPTPKTNYSQILTRQKAFAYTGEKACLSHNYRIIANEAFRGNTHLQNLELPSSIQQINARAFQGCSSLTKVYLPHSLTELGIGTFSNCSSLRTVYMSKQLSVIQKEIFREDRKLEQVLFTPDSQLIRIQQNAFCECTSLQFMLLPGTLKHIDERAFYRCKNLKSVRFPEGLTYIGKEAFYFCGLEKLELPESLEILEDSAFFKCSNLTEVCLPSHIQHIGKWVFHGCNRLKVLEIRHDPEFIGEWIINRAARIRCYRGSKVDEYCQKSGFTTEYIREEQEDENHD